jgi:hypothetical protein
VSWLCEADGVEQVEASAYKAKIWRSVRQGNVLEYRARIYLSRPFFLHQCR